MYNIYFKGHSMGRNSKFERDKALNWAMNQIWRGGFDSLSVKAISEELGITRSSFYHAFTSLEALYLEALQHYAQDSPHNSLLQQPLTNQPLKLITEVIRLTCLARSEDTNHRGCLMVNGVSELIGNHKELGSVIEQGVHDSIGSFENLLRRAQTLGELPATSDPHVLALALQTTLTGLNTLSKVVHSYDELWSGVELTLKSLGVYRT
jgi:TetR/AcrR family transcriptional regulator, transcriptional repressor for nem operon